jgi:hypothetical protein
MIFSLVTYNVHDLSIEKEVAASIYWTDGEVTELV